MALGIQIALLSISVIEGHLDIKEFPLHIIIVAASFPFTVRSLVSSSVCVMAHSGPE